MCFVCLCTRVTGHLRLVFTGRGQQVVDVDGFRAVLSSEQLLLQSLSQRRVGLDAPLQLQPQVSDLRQQLPEVHGAGGRGGDGLRGRLAGFCSEAKGEENVISFVWKNIDRKFRFSKECSSK